LFVADHRGRDHAGLPTPSLRLRAGHLPSLTPDWIPPPPYAYRDADVEAGVTYYYRLEAMDRTGGRQLFGPVSARLAARPGSSASDALGYARPSPFRPADGATVIEFTISRPGPAKLRLFDPAGRVVRSLISGPIAEGSHVVGWDGLDERGTRAAPGIYFYRLDTGALVSTRSVLLLP
jgi:hypothetical protein